MSAYHEIFIRTDKPIEQLIADVSAAAGAPIDRDETRQIPYAGSLSYAAVEIEFSHEFEQDAGMNFALYPILLTVRDFDNNKTREEELARDIFHKLCGMGYSLMLVFDLQVLLDQCGS